LFTKHWRTYSNVSQTLWWLAYQKLTMLTHTI